jgi:hypothetical protein
MRYMELTEAGLTNATLDNAIKKMAGGFAHGRTVDKDTCYAYVGEWLRDHPDLAPEAEIRLWGIKARPGRTEMIVHGDAMLPTGEIVSDMDPKRYANGQMEVVRSLSFDEFKKMAGV